MIGIEIYRDYWTHCVAEIPEIKSSLFVATEEGLGKKIKDITTTQFPVLVAVIPSASPNSRDVDNIIERHQAIIFLLTRMPAADRSDYVFIAHMDLMRWLMMKIKQLMTYDHTHCDSAYHQVMMRLDVGSFHQDPEYNYLGCDGWSLSFEFETEGY